MKRLLGFRGAVPSTYRDLVMRCPCVRLSFVIRIQSLLTTTPPEFFCNCPQPGRDHGVTEAGAAV